MENVKENGFQDIPEEVYYSNLWPLLNQNELLRMRTICQSTKKWVADYWKAKPDRTPEMEINEGDKTLEEYLQLDISTARLFLNNSNSGPFYFENNREAVARFLEKHGSKITHLRVAKQCRVLTSGEVEFLKGLKNLQVLLVDDWIKRPPAFEDDLDLFGANQPWPTLLSRLTEFSADVKLEVTHAPDYQEIIDRSLKYSNPRSTPNIVKLSLPCFSSIVRLNEVAPTLYIVSSETLLSGLTEQLIKRQQSDKVTLKSITFNLTSLAASMVINAVQEQLMERLRGNGNPANRGFFNLLQTCSASGITLDKVRRDWLSNRWSQVDVRDYEQYSSCITSMVTSTCTCSASINNLPCLERLDIFTTYCCQATQRLVIPALKILNINVSNVNDGILLAYFQNLFYNCVHGNLDELSMTFTRNCTWVPSQMILNWINLSCQGIKKLKICNWSQPTTGLNTFWGAMPLLEELHLENCPQLGDDVLTAGALEQLTNLKRIVLADLDKMPGITDAFLREVVSRKSLTHFIVSSKEPVASITVTGIRSLLDGPFAESIRKFPFKRWSLTSCTHEEWIELSKEFRSYYL